MSFFASLRACEAGVAIPIDRTRNGHTFSPARKYAKSRRDTFRRPRCSALPVADTAEHKRVPRSVCDAGVLSPRSTPGTANGTPDPSHDQRGKWHETFTTNKLPCTSPLWNSPRSHLQGRPTVVSFLFCVSEPERCEGAGIGIRRCGRLLLRCNSFGDRYGQNHRSRNRRLT